MPQGMIKLKEFQDLKQGYLSVTEYITHFSRLSHYALIDVDPDEKKQDYFLMVLTTANHMHLKLMISRTSRPWLTRPWCWRITKAQWSASTI
jgi:hypothetical protein